MKGWIDYGELAGVRMLAPHVEIHQAGRDTFVNRKNPDPGDAGLSRWNLNSNDSSIGIGDLNALNPAVEAPTSRPPMFGGQPAFFANAGSGPGVCPWPP